MKTIYIVRHAKSSWKYKGIPDRDRPLKQRGIEDAYLMSSEISKNIKRPDSLVSSHANRALSTAVIFCENMKFPLANLKINKSLYSFSDRYLLKTIKAFDSDFDTVIVFSHDHGINDFVNDHGNKKIDHIPTCSIVGIEFDCKHWKDIKKGNTILFKTPKELKKTHAKD